MNKKLFNKFLIVGIKFAVVISFSGIFVLAQEGINAQTGEQHGPSSEEIQQFEKEFGGPPQSFPEPTIERPQFEQPGSVPEEVKKYVSDKDLVAVYCAMTRWKSGQFFSAMDAVKKYVIEPTQQVEKDFEITLTIPDVDTIKAEGQKKIEDICGASTVAQAEQLVREFADWGQNQNQAKFDSLRSEMQDKLKTKGDGMREKIKTQLQPYIDEQKASIEAEIKVEAQQVADQLQITLNLPRYFNQEPIEDSIKHDSNCYEPWQFVQVCCDGTILPCWNTSRPLGDLNHQNFNEIWNNQAFQEFRRNLNSREELYRCRYCLDYRFRNIHNVNHHILVLEPET